ncbi:MAG: formylglycine-generating enzyme family protein, partial [Trichodesmium sp. St16_bin4-tuft]|nr:formylglycine-generating enzyme family protein [Trichodesmium sp. St16_bin4-tuft]
ECVSWNNATEFCQKLSKKTGKHYRLPSDAEWEYACRAGTTTPFYFGETITGELANYDTSNTYADEQKGEYRAQTTPVGQFPPNAFGLYDMHGNVWEWCQDVVHSNYDGAPVDGSAWVNGGDSSCRVLRGGSWITFPGWCRSAFRDYYDYSFSGVAVDDFIGFRLVSFPPRTPE